MAFKQITNIQRYELLEERLGISISSVGAWLQDDGENFYLRLNLEIIALNGGTLDHEYIAIKTSVLDENGVGLGTESTTISKSMLFGIYVFSEFMTLPSSNIGLIKIFPIIK